MSDNTSIFVRYTRKRHEFEVAHLEIGEQFDQPYWLDCATFRTEGTALKFAASLYVSLSQEDQAPEYGITPLYDATNLLPNEQKTLESWMEA
tara:strand:+ start:565 stop:840 length:276 start_codon:yes stop_codon:yes gene_type:complete